MEQRKTGRGGRVALAALVAVLVAFGHPAEAQDRASGTNDTETEAARALFVALWEEIPRLYPEVATFRGDSRFGHLWSDQSPAGKRHADDWWRDLQRRARGIERTRLSADDRLSLELLIHEADENVDFQRFEGARALTVSAMPFAFQTLLPNLLRSSPVDTPFQVEQLLERLRTYPPRIDQEIDSLPKARYEGAAETYSRPSMDGRRPGYFNANVVGFRARKTWQVEALTAHELIPGHHLQHARAIELGEVPAFRRDLGVTAYGEGWALYAETLGLDLGLYRDPYSRFGFLQFQMWRACRLVIDTGIHAFGWTREASIDYMKRHTGFDDALVAAEIDRYYSWPGQALAYMIGQIKLQELRERSRAALGSRFDIKAFHQVVLDSGQVPLSVLERVVDEWVARQAAPALAPASR